MKEKNVKNYIWNLVLSAMFMAIGLVLPFFTGQIPQIGRMLLPMHLPVLLCGLISLAVWRRGGLCTAAAAVCDVRHAPHLPHRSCHGL